jgi:hypothetical protein
MDTMTEPCGAGPGNFGGIGHPPRPRQSRNPVARARVPPDGSVTFMADSIDAAVFADLVSGDGG